ncbi:MAG: hypothetical protein ACI9WC_000132 [Arenicella sp.]|jgi:hypothetical protein
MCKLESSKASLDSQDNGVSNDDYGRRLTSDF